MDAHTNVLEVIDAHQHFWEPEKNYHPWLRDEPQISFRYGNYSVLKKPYLPEDYLAASVNFRVIGTAYVEAEWARGLAAEELAYIDGLRKRHALPTVAVAQAWLDEVDIDAQIEAITSFDFVRGIRHKPKSNPAPTSTCPSGMTSPHWRRGFAKLRPAGLRFDLQTPWWHLPEAARLACDFPRTQIIINHTGLPGDRSREGIDAWSKAMQQPLHPGNRRNARL
jgi:predicted TIM-barrel fold metal-dependent hydrolase